MTTTSAALTAGCARPKGGAWQRVIVDNHGSLVHASLDMPGQGQTCCANSCTMIISLQMFSIYHVPVLMM